MRRRLHMSEHVRIWIGLRLDDDELADGDTSERSIFTPSYLLQMEDSSLEEAKMGQLHEVEMPRP